MKRNKTLLRMIEWALDDPDGDYRVCPTCGRKTWSEDATVCGMTQPDGSKCEGVFEEQLDERAIDGGAN